MIKLLEFRSRNVDALNNKGLALNNPHKYQEAYRWYDKVLAIDPNMLML